MCRISLKEYWGLRLKPYCKTVLVEEVPAMWPLFMRIPELGEVVCSDGFRIGRTTTAKIDYNEEIDAVHVGAGGNLNEELRIKSSYVIVGKVLTQRMGTAVEFQYLARRLGPDDHFNPDGELISFILCAMSDPIRHGHFNLDRHDIRIVGRLA